MKTNVSSANQCSRASALIVTLLFGATVGLILLTYLELIESRTKIRARAGAWNSAIPVLEGGIEEGFAHLQKDSTNMTANGWTRSGTNANVIYQKSRTNTDGSYYVVTISNVASAPFLSPNIYSQGFVPAPFKQGYISRLVQVITTNQQTFSKAIAAKSTVGLSGGAVVDSFDSSNTNYSTGGRYDITKRRANGGVVSGSSAHPAISASGGHIYGLTDTAPGGTVTVSGSATIGDLTWTTGIQPGYTNNDFNFAYSDPPPPDYSSWTAPASGTYAVGGTNYDYVLGNSGYYSPTAFSMSAGTTMVVTGTASFYVNGNITVSSTYIYIAPGGSLKLYGGGTKTTISGSGVVNGTGNAANFSYYGMTNNVTVTYSGSAGFVGTMNAPEANLTISGSAAMVGAAIVNTFTDSGGAAIHYDENLGDLSPYVLLSYREL